MYLVRIKFDIYHRHSLIHFVVVSDHTTNSLRNILKHQVKIKLILFSRGEEAMLQRYNIRVVQKAHSLQFPVLVPLILKNLLYSHSFSSLQTLCLSQQQHNNKSKLSTHHKQQTYSNSKIPNRDYIKD